MRRKLHNYHVAIKVSNHGVDNLGDNTETETGETEHFEGHLFDEVVFNDSIEEFWKKKQELANYFDESHEEDIFDYIPPQKTNQIFTPR